MKVFQLTFSLIYEGANLIHSILPGSHFCLTLYMIGKRIEMISFSFGQRTGERRDRWRGWRKISKQTWLTSCFLEWEFFEGSQLMIDQVSWCSAKLILQGWIWNQKCSTKCWQKPRWQTSCLFLAFLTSQDFFFFFAGLLAKWTWLFPKILPGKFAFEMAKFIRQ